MSSYTISPTLNKNRVFILQKSELEKRWDPNTYHLERRSIIEALKKSGHQLKPLKFVSTFRKSIVKEIPNNTPYVGLENIESHTGSYIPTSEKESISSAIEFKKGQVLFPKLRPYLNKVYFAEFDGVCSTEFHVLDSKKVSNEYLANFLRTNLVVNQTKYLMSGNTLPRLQTEDIESLLIPILTKEDEEKINAIMRNVFAQKKTNEAQADKLLSGIDDYLLNELGIKLPEPPENTLKNRMFVTNISELSGSRFDPHFNKIFFKEVFNSFSKGNFSILRIKDVLDNIKTGTTPHQKLDPFTDNEGVVFLRNTNLKKYHIDLSDTKYVKTEFAKELTYSVKGEVIMCIAGTVGLTAINDIENPISINQNVSALKFDDTKINPDFASYWFNTSIFLELTKRACSVATIFYLNNDNLKLLPIPIPPLSKQKEIAKHISDIRQQAQQLKDKTNELLKKASEEIEKILQN